MYKHETAEELQALRGSTEYVQWRGVVYNRDECCCICGEYREPHAHHIKPFHFYPELRFEPDNGILLCKRCHWTIHGLEYEGPIPSIPYAMKKERYLGHAHGIERTFKDPDDAIDWLRSYQRAISNKSK